MPKASKEILALLKAYHKWAYEDCAPDEEPLYRGIGLCGNAHKFGGVDLRTEMARCFDIPYPFGIDDYNDRWIANTNHLCPKRRQWVEDTIRENEDA